MAPRYTPVVVDTSVWIDAFKLSPWPKDLLGLLAADCVLVHPWTIGELVTGSGVPAAAFALIRALPRVDVLPLDVTVAAIQHRKLRSHKVQWVDTNIALSAESRGVGVWATDAGLQTLTRKMGLPAHRLPGVLVPP